MRGRLGTNSRGDTIVEVLLAIAIVSSVLAGAFATTTRALKGTRLSQERAEALKVAEAQAEGVRTAAYSSGVDVFNPSLTLFCLPEDNFTERKNFGATTLPDITSDDYSSYPAECKNRSKRYNVSVQYENANGDLFSVRARWDGPTGNRQEVVLRFRIHENVANSLSGPVGAPSPPVPPDPPGPPGPPSNPVPPASQCQVTSNPIIIPELFQGNITVSHLYYDDRQIYNYNNAAGPLAALADGCQFDVYVTVRDSGHPTNFIQPNERLYIRFIFSDGTYVDTDLTDDLPENRTTQEDFVGRISFPSPPERVQFRHYSLHPDGDGDNLNSIDPASIRFVYAAD